MVGTRRLELLTSTVSNLQVREDRLNTRKSYETASCVDRIVDRELGTPVVCRTLFHVRTDNWSTYAGRSILAVRSYNLISGANIIGGGKMRARYQRGYLRLGHRKTGPDCWEFLWWDIELTGHRVRRKAVIGTVQQYPNMEEAWQASNGLRVSINEARNRQQEQLVTSPTWWITTRGRNSALIRQTRGSHTPRRPSTEISSRDG